VVDGLHSHPTVARDVGAEVHAEQEIGCLGLAGEDAVLAAANRRATCVEQRVGVAIAGRRFES
jgi:hypothetical protein